MALDELQNYQPHHLILSCPMEDLGANGIGGVDAGIARFIAPVKCRIRSIAISASAPISGVNGIRVDSASGTIGDSELQRSMRIPVQATPPSAFLCRGFESNNNLLEAGQMFRVKSDGAAGASIAAHISVVIEPLEIPKWPGPLMCITGEIPNGLAGTYRFPVPCGIEILNWWIGLSSTIAPQASNPFLSRNGAGVIGVGIQLAAGGDDLKTFTQDSNNIAADPDRFVPPDQHLLLSVAGAANFTTKQPFTILVRRTS